MDSLAAGGPVAPKQLINRPESKLSAIPKGSRVHKRPLSFFPVRATRRDPKSTTSATTAFGPDFDLDGYRMPARAPHTVVVKVSASTPFMAVVKRVRHALENGPQSTKGLPLTARIAALGVDAAKTAEQMMGPVSDALDEVVLVATGRAITKAIEVGMFMRGNKELTVVVRTRTVSAIDDVVMGGCDEEEEGEEQVRIRQLSCVEVGIRHRK